MSDDDLLATLRGLGVDADREKLAELYRAVTSDGLDEIAKGPAGQLRFLLAPAT